MQTYPPPRHLRGDSCFDDGTWRAIWNRFLLEGGIQQRHHRDLWITTVVVQLGQRALILFLTCANARDSVIVISRRFLVCFSHFSFEIQAWAGATFKLCISSHQSAARLMQAQVHQRKFAEDQSLNIDTPPIKVSLKRKAVNAAKSTAWYTSAAFLFLIATCHTLVGFIILPLLNSKRRRSHLYTRRSCMC